MFQFSGFAPDKVGYYVFNIVGCPIRKSTDQCLCAAPRSLSQLITSFFASVSLGIRRTPLITSLDFFYYRVSSLNMSMNFTPFGYVENIGVEPMTSCLQSRRSSQLS